MTDDDGSARELAAKLGVEEFRCYAREWLAQHAVRLDRDGVSFDEAFELTSSDPEHRGTASATARAFQRGMWEAGLAALSWPTEVGGMGFGVEEELVLLEELAGYDVPTRMLTMGLHLCAQAVLHAGTEAQRRRLLPRTARGDVIWCQL